ncbi:immunoglobulin I-set domain protein [Streptomyces sp. NPDC002328]|uniref:immunoglobulin I-set domain protein n=1 Tax=Streptomyces sp. NPDC002328 TaxID=3364642 RepID=UPI00369DA95A
MHLRRLAALLGAAALMTASVAAGPAAQAADTPKTALGKDGQKLTVSATANLDPAGETLRVTGAGYDTSKAVYVAVCRDNGDGKLPTPCIGGVNLEGHGNASHWIVPVGDVYDGPLTLNWGAGGTFDVEIKVPAKDANIDCLRYACSVVTRVDHRNSGDRSQDVRVPVTWKGQDTGGGDGGGDGVDVPPGTVSYVRSAAFTGVGRPLDLLLHPDSGKLYVGSDNIPDTADVREQGLYAVDPQDGKVRSYVTQAPGLNGAVLANVAVREIAAPLAGDGVLLHYPLRGLGTAKDGDAAVKGHWYTGATFTGFEQDADTSSVLVAAGPELRRVDLATGAVKKTAALEGGNQLGVDAARNAAWSIGTAEGKKVLRRVDTATFQVTATNQIPDDSYYFVETDPATGNVWLGGSTSVLVRDKDGKELTTLTGTDRPVAAAFDKTTGRAFVLRGDIAGSAADDDDGSLEILDSATFRQAAPPVTLAGNESSTYAGIAVTPGATSVYVTDYTAYQVVKIDLHTSPKVTQAPTDRTVAPGDEVTFVAAAEGTPAPTVSWSVSTDGGYNWTKIEGATKNAYTFDAKAVHDGHEYRAEFKNTVGTTRTAPITLTVKASDGGTDGGTDGGNGGETPSGPSGTKTGTGASGQKLTVTPVNGLATEDQKVKITGSGYDVKKGIYVALCVDNGAGQLPTPCIGGVDMSGGSHSSAWISSNPPDYGQELATPYGAGGTFSVELTLDAKDQYTDCFKAKCVLATRADHTLSGDRSQDVKVPVSFVGQDPVDTDDGTTGGTTGGSTSGSTGGSSGGSATGGSTTGGSTGGVTGGSGTTGGTSATGSSGGSLASTGATVGTAAGAALLLTAAGWYVRRRAQAARTGR